MSYLEIYLSIKENRKWMEVVNLTVAVGQPAAIAAGALAVTALAAAAAALAREVKT